MEKGKVCVFGNCILLGEYKEEGRRERERERERTWIKKGERVQEMIGM